MRSGSTLLPVGFVVPRHAADEEVEQERFIGVSGAIEQVQFVVGMGYNQSSCGISVPRSS